MHDDTAVRSITAEPITPEAFAPFGVVLSPDGHERQPIDLYGGTKDVYRAGTIESDRPIEWLIVRSRLRPFKIVYLERHLELTQAFVPLGGSPLLVVVARADAREENGIPLLDELRAFVIPGDSGAQIYRGVWHEPPYSLLASSVSLTTSHQSLTKGLGADLDERGEIKQADVEKRNLLERVGYEVEIRLPQ